MKNLESLQADFKKVAAFRPTLRANNEILPDASQNADLRAILASVDMPEECERFINQCEDSLFEWLVKTGELDQNIRMRPASQKGGEAFLQNCVNRFSELLSQQGVAVSRPMVELISDKRKIATSGTTFFWPLCKPERDAIEINTVKHKLDVAWPVNSGPDYIEEAFEEDVPMRCAILTACHEMRHFFHISLGRAYYDGTLKEDDIFYGFGMYFRELFRWHGNENAYIQTKDSREFNKLQLDERCAYLTGSRMAVRIDNYLTTIETTPAFVRALHPTTFIGTNASPQQAQLPILTPV